MESFIKNVKMIKNFAVNFKEYFSTMYAAQGEHLNFKFKLKINLYNVDQSAKIMKMKK